MVYYQQIVDHLSSLPAIECPLNENDYSELEETVQVFSPSTNYGIDLYLATVDFVNQNMNINIKEIK